MFTTSFIPFENKLIKATVSLFSSKARIKKYYFRNVTKFYYKGYQNVPLVRLNLVAGDKVGLIVVIDSKFIHQHEPKLVLIISASCIQTL